MSNVYDMESALREAAAVRGNAASLNAALPDPRPRPRASEAVRSVQTDTAPATTGQLTAQLGVWDGQIDAQPLPGPEPTSGDRFRTREEEDARMNIAAQQPLADYAVPITSPTLGPFDFYTNPMLSNRVAADSSPFAPPVRTAFLQNLDGSTTYDANKQAFLAAVSPQPSLGQLMRGPLGEYREMTPAETQEAFSLGAGSIAPFDDTGDLPVLGSVTRWAHETLAKAPARGLTQGVGGILTGLHAVRSAPALFMDNMPTLEKARGYYDQFKDLRSMSDEEYGVWRATFVGALASVAGVDTNGEDLNGRRARANALAGAAQRYAAIADRVRAGELTPAQAREAIEPGVFDPGQSAVLNAGVALTRWSATRLQARPEYADGTMNKLVEGVASTAVIMAPALLAGIVAPPAAALIAGVTASSLTAAGEQVQRALEFGATPMQIVEAGMAAAPLGLLDILPIGALVKMPSLRQALFDYAIEGVKREGSAFLRKGLRGAALSVGARVAPYAGVAGAEAATEMLQQIAQNAIARGIYDPRANIFEGVLDAGEQGALVGTAFAVMRSAILRAAGYRSPRFSDLAEHVAASSLAGESGASVMEHAISPDVKAAGVFADAKLLQEAEARTDVVRRDIDARITQLQQEAAAGTPENAALTNAEIDRLRALVDNVGAEQTFIRMPRRVVTQAVEGPGAAADLDTTDVGASGEEMIDVRVDLASVLAAQATNRQIVSVPRYNLLEALDKADGLIEGDGIVTLAQRRTAPEGPAVDPTFSKPGTRDTGPDSGAGVGRTTTAQPGATDARGRGAFREERAPRTDGAGTDARTRQQLAISIRKRFSLAVREFTAKDRKKNTDLGYYQPGAGGTVTFPNGERVRGWRKALTEFRAGVIAMRKMNDVETLIHEAAHAVHFENFDAINALLFDKANRTELYNVAANLYAGGSAEFKSEWLALTEGFAEFFRVYVTGAAGRAAEIAPNFNRAFEAYLSDNSRLRKAVEDTRADYETYYQSSVRARLVAKASYDKNANVETRESSGSFVGDLLGGAGRLFDRVYSAVVANEHYLARYQNELQKLARAFSGGTLPEVPITHDPVKLQRMLDQVGVRSVHMLQNGVLAYNTLRRTSRGLNDAFDLLDPKGGARTSGYAATMRADFSAYLVARHEIAQHATHGKTAGTPYTLAEARVVVSEMEAKYGADKIGQAANIVHEFQDAMLDRAQAAGIFPSDFVQQLKASYADFVPLRRRQYVTPLGKSEVSRNADGSYRVTGRLSDKDTTPEARREAAQEMDVINVLQVIAQRAMQMELAIARNDINRAFVRMHQMVGPAASRFIERMPDKKVERGTVSVGDIRSQLDGVLQGALAGSGIDPADVAMALQMLDDSDTFSYFRNIDNKLSASERGFVVFENGQRTLYRLRPELFEGVDANSYVAMYDALMGMPADATKMIDAAVAAIATGSTVLRTAITTHPTFLFADFIRNQFSAAMLVPGFIPFWSGMRGTVDSIRSTDAMQQYLSVGGVRGGLNVNTAQTVQYRSDLSQLANKGYLVKVIRPFFAADRGIASKLSGGIESVAQLTELAETGTRLGIFETVYDRLVRDYQGPLTDEVKYTFTMEAAFQARDYIDFSRHGSRMGVMRRIIPFLNASLQGIDKAARVAGGARYAGLAMQDILSGRAYGESLSNAEYRKLQGAQHLIGWMLILGMASALHAWWLSDDENYQEVTPFQRSRGWYFPLGDRLMLEVPKPFELAMIANIFEQGVLNYMTGNRLNRDMLDLSMATLTPPYEAPIVQLVFEQALNRDLFTGRDIVPQYLQNVDPREQYTERTSELAKKLGAITGLSPMRLDHALTTVLGPWGRDLQNFSNRLAATVGEDRAPNQMSDSFFISRFLKDPLRYNNVSEGFNAYAGRVNSDLQRGRSTYRNAYVDRNDPVGGANYLSNLPEAARAYALLGHPDYGADDRRLHPAARAQVMGAAIRDIVRGTITGDLRDPASGEAVQVPARVRARARDLLMDIQNRELRNTLVLMKVDGWQNKKLMDVATSYDLLREVAPEIADILDVRLRSGRERVYTWEAVSTAYPKLVDRLRTASAPVPLDDLTRTGMSGDLFYRAPERSE